MIRSQAARAGRIALALTLAVSAQTLSWLPSQSIRAETIKATVSVAPAQVVAPIAVPVDGVIEKNVVYTGINDEVKTRLSPYPAVDGAVDNLKLQINNRMNIGLLDGKLTNEEMDEVQVMLDQVQRQEADFKVGGCGLTPGAAHNLMSKYHMVDQRLSDLLDNSNFNEYMPNFELRRMFLQRRIQFNLAAGNLTPSEAEQLLAALNTASDVYASANATGGTLTANELEASLRDLNNVYGKVIERISGTIAFVAPSTHSKLAELRSTIDAAICSKRFSEAERAHMLEQYDKLVELQDSVVADEGPRSAGVQVLAKEIDNLNFILTRELRDRQVAAGPANPM